MPDEITETFAVFYGDRATSMIKANRWVIDNDILVTSFFYITARNQLLITFKV